MLSSLSNVNSISSANIVINNNITNVEESGIKYNPRIIIIIIIKNLSKWKIFEKCLIYIYIYNVDRNICYVCTCESCCQLATVIGRFHDLTKTFRLHHFSVLPQREMRDLRQRYIYKIVHVTNSLGMHTFHLGIKRPWFAAASFAIRK